MIFTHLALLFMQYFFLLFSPDNIKSIIAFGKLNMHWNLALSVHNSCDHVITSRCFKLRAFFYISHSFCELCLIQISSLKKKFLTGNWSFNFIQSVLFNAIKTLNHDMFPCKYAPQERNFSLWLCDASRTLKTRKA